jgi:integrase
LKYHELRNKRLRLLKAARNNLRDYTLLLLGFYSGVRVGEVGFDYNSIIWEEGYVSIWDGEKDRYRKIYVPETVLNSLRRY